jgi:hypothetical protein
MIEKIKESSVAGFLDRISWVIESLLFKKIKVLIGVEFLTPLALKIEAERGET